MAATYRYRSQYLRRAGYRRHGEVPKPVLVAALVVAAVAASGAAATHHHGAHAAIPATITAAGSYTPASWAPAFLAAAGLPRTRCDQSAVVAWEGAEGGNWANSARYNPLDTTQPEPGSYAMNSAGVQAYSSWSQGLAANAATLRNGLYPGILAALQAGNDAQAVADAVASSPWGTGLFSASC